MLRASHHGPPLLRSMSLGPQHTTVDPVAAALPFGVLDVEEANAVFVRWRDEHRPADKRVVDLWTYCYIRQYFLSKFLTRSYGGAADVELLIEKAYRRIADKRSTVATPSRYASWVSVVARHIFLNYIRSAQPHVSLDSDEGGPTLVAEDTDDVAYDAVYAHRVVNEAIGRLPPFLQEVARLGLLHDRSYAAISDLTGRPVGTVRTYMHRALKKLRNDPGLKLASEALWGRAPSDDTDSQPPDVPS